MHGLWLSMLCQFHTCWNSHVNWFRFVNGFMNDHRFTWIQFTWEIWLLTETSLQCRHLLGCVYARKPVCAPQTGLIWPQTGLHSIRFTCIRFPSFCKLVYTSKPGRVFGVLPVHEHAVCRLLASSRCWICTKH